MPLELQKISVNLPKDLVSYIQNFAAHENMTMTEALRRAISMMKFIEESEEQGKALLRRDPTTKETERVIFR